MHVDQLRKTLNAQPFRPFTIHLGDGRALEVPHPDFAWIHPGGHRTAIVATSLPDDFEIIDVGLVTSLEVGNGQPERS